MSLVAAVNRGQWTKEHFVVAGKQVLLTDAGRRLVIELYETRKQDLWKHPVVGYSLSYGRAVELEARLLEKEWSGAPGLFARMRRADDSRHGVYLSPLVLGLLRHQGPSAVAAGLQADAR